MKKLDLKTWKRKEHFEFFSNFDEPFFGIVTEIEVTNAYHYCKNNEISFFAYYLYQSLKAANQLEAFRYRIIEGEVIIFDEIHASATIGRKDDTFAFSFSQYQPNFELFSKNLSLEIAELQKTSGLNLSDETARQDVIHYSSIPWTKFTGLTHARSFQHTDSAPKISFGKMYEENEKKWMSVAINVHHGLMDGIEIGRYLSIFQSLMNG
ncbi:chloramphenicol acetyltransferase [Persicobacter diffluens]|uniref:Chloramphenicol acetyltransferase n=1 Tax=Persicobacter diffluens TaxID=981 RepID=A0AAN4W307_9BACT|nr:chloramphenicol acetyltransferase [Persicobacter diffluens]